MTAPGHTGWTQADLSGGGNKGTALSKDLVYLDVDTGPCRFTDKQQYPEPPRYFTALGGSKAHWRARGAHVLFWPRRTGFRVFVKHDLRVVAPGPPPLPDAAVAGDALAPLPPTKGRPARRRRRRRRRRRSDEFCDRLAARLEERGRGRGRGRFVRHLVPRFSVVRVSEEVEVIVERSIAVVDGARPALRASGVETQRGAA